MPCVEQSSPPVSLKSLQGHKSFNKRSISKDRAFIPIVRVTLPQLSAPSALFSASDLVNESVPSTASLLSLHLDLLVCKPLSFLRKPSQGPELPCCSSCLFALVKQFDFLCPCFPAESAFDFGLLHN